MCPVIERIDWTANTIYSQYSSETNMFLLDSEHKLQKKFYVKNSYDQVFKCLSNGAPNAVKKPNACGSNPGASYT